MQSAGCAGDRGEESKSLRSRQVVEAGTSWVAAGLECTHTFWGAQVGNPCCTAEILLKPGALQNWGLNQERNIVVVNQVKCAELR